MAGKSTSLSLEGVRQLSGRAYPEEGKSSLWTDDPTIELPIRLGTTFPANAPPVTVPFAFSQSVERHHSLPALRVVSFPCSTADTLNSETQDRGRFLFCRSAAASGWSGRSPSTMRW